MTPSSQEITQWLVAWSNGDQTALDQLIPLVHEELRRLAKRYMRQERGRERRGVTLQTTALVNEAYVRLIDAGNVQWESRAHFFAIAAQLMRRILVDYARSRNRVKQGIIHRDLKPENIFLTSDGRVKILDFGLARVKSVIPESAGNSTPSALNVSRPGKVRGTVGYMSPEQVCGEEVDAPSDIFSLGCVLYEMMTGRRPFARQTPQETMAAVLRDAPPKLPKPADSGMEIPLELERAITRCLERQAESRYQSAHDLAVDLKAVSRGSEISAPPPASKLPRRRPAVWIIAMLALLFVGAALALWLTRGQGDNGAINSVAVLPFVNVAADAQMEYLPDGITESIIQSLSQLPELRVMARGAVFTYKGREVDPRQVGAALKVRAVVLGRVQRQGEQLLIEAELVDASDGSRLWGEQYHRPLDGLFVVQEEIAREISEKLRLRLSGEQRRQLAKRPTDNSAAYHLYLKGNHHIYQYTRASQEKALGYFQQAITLDPNYALAHAGIAKVYADLSGGDYLLPVEAMPKAKQAAERALAADETLAEAHYAMAMVKWWGDWDWPGAEREFRRALELNPNFVTARSYYSRFLSREGRFAEALREAERAEQLDPLSLPVSSEIISVLYLMRQYDRAIEQCRNTLELHPSDLARRLMHQSLGDIFIQKHMYQEAVAEWRQAITFDRNNRNLGRLGYAYARAGQKAEARQILQELEVQATRRRVSPVHIARIYVGLGDNDRALDWLRKGYDERSDHVLSLGVDPAYDGLRSDPRFIEMLRGIGPAPI